MNLHYSKGEVILAQAEFLPRCWEKQITDDWLELYEEVVRLQAMVAKVEKTADGVLVVLEMEVWVQGKGLWDDKLWAVTVSAIDSKGYITANIGGRPLCWHVSKCYSTREAAAAALKEARKP